MTEKKITKHKTRRKVGRRVTTTFSGNSLTEQSHRDSCNINKIMKRYERTGVIDHINRHQPVYGDFSDIGDYQVHLDTVIRAESLFMELPATVRKEFDNDPVGS